MDTEIIEVLKATKDLIAMLDSLSMEDISEDLSDAICDSNDILDNLVSALEEEAMGK